MTRVNSKNQLWKDFFAHQTNELNDMWVAFLSSIQVDEKFYSDQLLIQSVGRHLFNFIIKRESPVYPTSPVQVPSVQSDETNALRYAAGFVLRSVRNQLCKSNSPSSTALVTFINSLQEDVNDDTESASSYLEYTKVWINKVNRGGLFSISDNVYETFHAMEIVQRTYLKDLHNPFHTALHVDKLIQLITEDDDVQFWWAIVCAPLDDDLAEILLEKITRLWTTIRGFSYTSSIVEQYKQSTKEVLQRKHALRKNLKANTCTHTDN